MHRLRVAVDATPLLGARSGVGVFVHGALGALAGRGDVDLLAYGVTWRRFGALAGEVPAGVAVGQRPMPARPLHACWRHGGGPALERFIGPADVVHGTNFVVPPTRRAARVVTVHDLTIVRFPELVDEHSRRYPALIRRAVAAGAFVHTPSHAVAAEVVEHFGVDPERVRAVHHGLPQLPPGDRSWRRALPPGTDRYLLAVGTIEPRKDYPTLLAAFGRLAADAGDLALVVVGGAGWGTDAFEAALGRLPGPVRRRVVAAGYLDDAGLADALEGAAVLAYPSRYEGFGFPPLQAMALGVPVVATRAGSLPEVLDDGAVLVDVGDPDGLAGALEEALGGGEPVRQRVERGLTIAGRYTWTSCAEGLVALYSDARSLSGAAR